MKDLIWQPFEASYKREISIGATLGNLLFGVALGGAIPAALWVAFGGGWAVLLSTLLSALGALLVALVVLTLREVAIIFLILISPIALVLWVLPGTEQWAKRWWGLFTKLLLMYPAFMALLAIGEVMSAVAAGQNGGNNSATGAIENVIAIAIYLIPFFMLPFLFKMMGGVMGQVAGMVNDREKGLIDRSKNWSKEKKANSRQGIDRTLRKQDRQSELKSKRIGNIASGSTMRQRMGSAGLNRIPGINNYGDLSESGMASLENAVVKEEMEGLAREGLSGESLAAFSKNAKTPAAKKAAMLRALQTQDFDAVNSMRVELSQTTAGRKLYDQMVNTNYDAFNSVSPGSTDAMIKEVTRPDGTKTIVEKTLTLQEIHATDAQKFSAMSENDKSNLSNRQWQYFDQASSTNRAVNGGPNLARESVSTLAAHDKLNVNLKWDGSTPEPPPAP